MTEEQLMVWVRWFIVGFIATTFAVRALTGPRDFSYLFVTRTTRTP